MINKEGKKAVESLWRKEKYKVMFYNQNQYNYIRQLMRDQLDDVSLLEQVIRKTYEMTPTRGSKLNSYQHMWGYFKKIATDDEKVQYQTFVNNFDRNETELHTFLKQLAEKYDIHYLKNSSILF